MSHSVRTPIETSAAPAAIGAYSQAIRAGELIFTAGQLGADPATGELADGVAAQADRVLRNLAAILDAAGGVARSGREDHHLPGRHGDFATVNEVYARHFPAPYPARSTIAVKALPQGALVEIECSRHCAGGGLTDTIARHRPLTIGASAPVLATAAIVLAAGQGTRMRSRAAQGAPPAGRASDDRPRARRRWPRPASSARVVVTGHGAEQLEAALAGRVPTVRQEPQLGTADAVRCGLGRVPPEARQVLVTMGDVPLLPGELFQHLLREQAEGEAADRAAVALTWTTPPATAASCARPMATRERDRRGGATPIPRRGRSTRSTPAPTASTPPGCAPTSASVPASPSGEYYLTDLVAVAVAGGRRVAVVTAPRPELAMGINDRVELAAAERLLRREIAERHMRNGVTIVDPASTFIDAGGRDRPGRPHRAVDRAGGRDGHRRRTRSSGRRREMRDSRIGPRTRVWASVIEESTWPRTSRSDRTATSARAARSGRAARSATTPSSRKPAWARARSSTTSATWATPRSARRSTSGRAR